MTLLLSRWQFGITTVFHFIFVPLTIGLALLLAIMQTAAYRSRHDAEKQAKWERMAVFWRRLFLINFAIGVVTGIVQEFQFGMNWSEYSRYVGSVFGAPLAVEALLAFFLESTFLGIWIFGKDRVSARIHLASIWLVSIGTMLSAYFILAANAWMQHPVGYKIEGNRAIMTNFWAVMTNSTLISSFLHVLHRGTGHGGDADARRQRLAPPSDPEGRRRPAPGVLRLGQAGPHRGRHRRRRHHVLRRQPGPTDGEAAAHEDGRRRGAVQHRRTAPASRS